MAAKAAIHASLHIEDPRRVDPRRSVSWMALPSRTMTKQDVVPELGATLYLALPKAREAFRARPFTQITPAIRPRITSVDGSHDKRDHVWYKGG